MSPVLVHIFEDSVNIETTMESLMSIMQLTSIPTFAFHLGLVFSDFPQDLQPLQSSKDPLIGSEHSGNLDLLLESFKSSTAKLDVVEKLRLYLLHTIAVKLNCTKVLLGDSGSRLAVRVFTHTALARGSQIQDDSTFNDRRYSVPFLRPMKDLTAKEVSLLNHYSRPDAIESWK